MTEVRRPDPAVRRLAVLLVIVGVLVATLLIVGFKRYGTGLRDWLLSEPGELGYRVRLVFFLSAAVLTALLVPSPSISGRLVPRCYARGSFHRLGIG